MFLITGLFSKSENRQSLSSIGHSETPVNFPCHLQMCQKISKNWKRNFNKVHILPLVLNTLKHISTMCKCFPSLVRKIAWFRLRSAKEASPWARETISATSDSDEASRNANSFYFEQKPPNVNLSLTICSFVFWKEMGHLQESAVARIRCRILSWFRCVHENSFTAGSKDKAAPVLMSCCMTESQSPPAINAGESFLSSYSWFQHDWNFVAYTSRESVPMLVHSNWIISNFWGTSSRCLAR